MDLTRKTRADLLMCWHQSRQCHQRNYRKSLKKNVSTFETGFAATISSETFDNMLYDVVMEYQQSNQATEEKSMLYQRLGKGPDGSGCSYITFDLAHIY